VLSAEATSGAAFTSIVELLSGAGVRDDGSLKATIAQLVRGKEEYSWVRKNPAKLTKLIDLMTKLSMDEEPALVRAYLEDENAAPEVRASAFRYVGSTLDSDALISVLKWSAKSDGKTSSYRFAVYSLDPANKELSSWFADLDKSANDYDLAALYEIALISGQALRSWHHGAEKAKTLRQRSGDLTRRLLVTLMNNQATINILQSGPEFSVDLAGGKRFQGEDRQLFNRTIH